MTMGAKKLFSVWEDHYLGLEASSVLVLTIVFAVWIIFSDVALGHIDGLLNGNRQNLYGRIATISGTLMGFGFAVGSFVILATTSSEKFSLLRGSPYYDQLWKTYIQTVTVFILLTITSLVCLVLDTDTSPCPWVLVPFVFISLLSTVRLFRCLWLLQLVIKVVSRPESKF